MFKPAFDTPFVCLEDVCTGYVELNPVVWNPSLTTQENEKIVREILKKYFYIEIDDEHLHRLVSVTSAAEFAKEFIGLL